MSDIKLDPRKLLGFKIIATGRSAMTLRSPKIGGKGCQAVETASTASGAALRAKIGQKLPG